MKRYTNNEIFEKMMDNGVCFEATCQSHDGSNKIENIIKNSIRFSYKKALALIEEHDPFLFHSLCLEYPNPWSNKTYVSRDGKYLVVTHSAIEYLFSSH